MMSAKLATGIGENEVNHSAAIAFAKKVNDPTQVTTLPIKLVLVSLRKGNRVIHRMNASPF